MFLFNSKLSQTILSHVFHMITKLFFSVEKNENKINIFSVSVKMSLIKTLFCNTAPNCFSLNVHTSVD